MPPLSTNPAPTLTPLKRSKTAAAKGPAPIPTPPKRARTAAAKHPTPTPTPLETTAAKNPAPTAALLRDPNVRRHVQHEPIIRGGVADPQELKTVKEYWSTRRGDVVESFVPKGETSPPAKAGAPPPPPQRVDMLKNGAQAFIRQLIKIDYDLGHAGYCFARITADTFVVDEHTGVPMISTSAFEDDVVPVTSAEKEAKVNANLSDIADIIEDDVIGTDNPMPEEVKDGLLDMMRNEGYKRRYVILNHSSLVPLENRLDLGLRMYQHLYDIIEKLKRKNRDWVVDRLVFPRKWHKKVRANSYLKKVYRKGNYSTYMEEGWKRIQGCEAHRFNRNTSEHALENSVVNNQAMYTRPEVAIMLHAVFPLLLHSLMRELDRLGKIREIEVESLFRYHRDA